VAQKKEGPVAVGVVRGVKRRTLRIRTGIVVSSAAYWIGTTVGVHLKPACDDSGKAIICSSRMSVPPSVRN
jgi:hypothetical protein